MPLSLRTFATMEGVKGMESWFNLCFFRTVRRRILVRGLCLWGKGLVNCFTNLVAISLLFV